MAQRSVRKATFKAVIQMPLMPDEVEHIITVSGNDYGTCWGELLRLIERGYKLSLAYQADRKQWSASLLCEAIDDDNAGYMLFGNAPTLEQAVAALWYKHVVKSEGGAWGKADGGAVMGGIS